MADQPIIETDTDDFLGVREAPAWQRYAKWGAIAVGVVLLFLLAKHFMVGDAVAGYATEPVTRGALTTTVSATGKLAPTNQVEVGSELSGLVTKVLVDVNDRVITGQPLALIDPSRYDDAIKQAQAALNANTANVAQARATLAQTQAQLDRELEVSRLSGGRVPAKVEIDQARADRDRATAGLKSSQANVVSTQAQLSSANTERTKAIIRSPVNGVVLARQIEPGQTVAASFSTPTLFVIAEDLSQMKLEVAIDEADVGAVKQGQDATFAVDAFPGKTFPAKIIRVDLGSNLSAQTSATASTSTSAGQVVSYGATLSVANADQQLRPGMTATADIVTLRQDNVLLVPNAALRFTPQTEATPAAAASGGITGALVPSRGRRGRRGAGQSDTGATTPIGGQQTVYVKSADGSPEPVKITTGATNGTMTAVTGGDLKPGMQVITGQLSGKESAASAGGRRGGKRRSGGAAGGNSSAGAGGGQRGQ